MSNKCLKIHVIAFRVIDLKKNSSLLEFRDTLMNDIKVKNKIFFVFELVI